MSSGSVDGVLQLDDVAAELVHESFSVDTSDREDHTFCGIMFDCQCRPNPSGPIDYIEVQSVAVRGKLGPLTVWRTLEGGHAGKHETAEAWTKVYEANHSPSKNKFVELTLTTPIRLRVGERCGLYVHSALSGDQAIVYDDQHHHRLSYEDKCFQVFPGKAHLANKPFGKRGMWWGSPWRREREFVGRLCYGVRWKMWVPRPEVHLQFPRAFRRTVEVMLMGSRRPESLLYLLQDEIVLFIMNKCWWSWWGEDDGRESSRSAARKRRLFTEAEEQVEEVEPARRKGKSNKSRM